MNLYLLYHWENVDIFGEQWEDVLIGVYTSRQLAQDELNKIGRSLGAKFNTDFVGIGYSIKEIKADTRID